MKSLKKLLLFCFLFAVIFAGLNLQNFSQASAVDNPPLETDIFDYVTITQSGQILNNSNVKISEDEHEITIYANESATITFNPFERNYTISSLSDTMNFVDRQNTIIIEKTDPDTYPDTFEYKGYTYYFRISTQNVLSVYKNNPAVAGTTTTMSTANSDLVSFVEDDSKITITYTESYTLLSSASDSRFIFTVGNLSTIRQINFIRPIINFSNSANTVVEFNTFEQMDGGEYYPPTSTIQSEQIFNKIQINFINNNYTENNPLYFDINYNGFTYSLMLYSKEYNSTNYLYVNYFDENNNENNYYVATPLILDENNELVPDTRYGIDASRNLFSFIFENTGRYSFEVYDSTYIYGMKNSNYYQTSFYIVDEESSDFENIYMIAQTTEDDGTEIEYIVSTSTLNNNVKLSIKNLTAIGSNTSLDKVIDHVEVIQALFGGSGNIPIPTSYSVEEILDMIDENGDVVFEFNEDAYYQVYIYPYVEEGQEQYSPEPKLYEFTLIKQAKTTFTIGDYTHEATIPYHTEIIDYTFNINSPMEFKVKFSSQQAEVDETINKTYVNRYEIMYGMEDALIQKIEAQPSTGEDDEEEAPAPTDSLTVQFFGVGALKVTVTFNNQTTVYDLNSEEGNNTLTFTEYGTYTFELVDSMGTTRTAMFTLEKKLNTSAIVLIVLSCVIVAAVVIFVLVARSRIKTR